jgi:prepilin-type N-terminal cleavage/methylation domain-containing protein
MLNKLLSIFRSQKGFTFVELLVAIAITAVIGSVMVITLTQLITVQAADKNRTEAYKQVENALHYLNRDIQMASAGDIVPQDGSAVLFTSGLHLQWIDYDISFDINNTVDYILNSTTGELTRHHQVMGVSDITNVVARHIDAVSDYSFDGAVLTINLTSTIEGFESASESRTLQAKPRIN